MTLAPWFWDLEPCPAPSPCIEGWGAAGGFHSCWSGTGRCSRKRLLQLCHLRHFFHSAKAMQNQTAASSLPTCHLSWGPAQPCPCHHCLGVGWEGCSPATRPPKEGCFSRVEVQKSLLSLWNEESQGGQRSTVGVGHNLGRDAAHSTASRHSHTPRGSGSRCRKLWVQAEAHVAAYPSLHTRAGPAHMQTHVWALRWAHPSAARPRPSQPHMHFTWAGTLLAGGCSQEAAHPAGSQPCTQTCTLHARRHAPCVHRHPCQHGHACCVQAGPHPACTQPRTLHAGSANSPPLPALP